MDKITLQQRTKQFALRVFHLTKAMPRTAESQVISRQIVRSASSVAANYRAACRGRSRAEFLAKLGIVEEESDETVFWLEMIMEAEIFKKEKITPLLKEANEIVSIIVASLRSAKKNKSAIRNRKSEI